MTVEVESGRLGTEADVSFHMAIAYASKNPLQVYIMKELFDILFVGIKENLAALYENPDNIDLIIQQHTEIYKAIESRDPEAARQCMERHINFVLNFFKNRE